MRRTQHEIESALLALGGTLDDPKRTGGWRPALERGTASVLATGSTAAPVPEGILPHAQGRGETKKLTYDEVSLRGFCARILGWAGEQAVAVENALRSIHLSITHRAALVLLGKGDLVPIAHALHRRTLGAERPFVVCDRRRMNVPASVRAPTNYASGMVAVRAARGGTLCVRRAQIPGDFSSVVALVRDPTAAVQLIVCEDVRHDADPLLALPVPIRVPSLKARVSELPRIVDEYARDAISTLGADGAGFTSADRTWVLEHAAGTLSEIEKATLRLVALRMSGSLNGAAQRLGMSRVALEQWFGRRRRRRRCAPISDRSGT